MAPTPRLPAVIALCAALCGADALAQPADSLAPPPPDTTATRYGSSVALALLLTEEGLGVGAQARTPLSGDLSFVFEAALGAGRDEREQRFFVGFFGETVTPLKRNYVLLAPLHLGLERRLFRRRIEDTFRPFVSVVAGPTLALQWPYFDDADGDGVRSETEERLGPLRGLPDARPRLGVGGTVAVGAAVGRVGRAVQSLRFGFTGHAFPVEIDLLELDPEVESPSRHTFWTPTVSFHVVRLLEPPGG